MTLAYQFTVLQDGELLHHAEREFSEEDDDFLWLHVLGQVVRDGRDARAVYYGPPPKPADKLPREAWDREMK